MSREKPFAGTVRAWCRHKLEVRIPKDDNPEPNVLRIEYFTGEVVEDKLKRWRAGTAMCSSPIVNFDEITLLIETENSLYQLIGPGRMSKTFPFFVDSEVGITRDLLDSNRDRDAENTGEIVIYPGSKEQFH